MSYLRDGRTRFTQQHIDSAIDGSLQRLQTDYIDLYQLHWPDRRTNFFGQLGYQHNPDDELTPFEDTLEALDKQVKAGKIRHIGLSNETPWGVSRFLQLAEERGWPRMASIQNPYNLLNRTYEIGLAEMSLREQCGLLAYSPLAFGALTGKYLNGLKPEKGRLTLFSRFNRYSNPQAERACAAGNCRNPSKPAKPRSLNFSDRHCVAANKPPRRLDRIGQTSETPGQNTPFQPSLADSAQ